MSNDLVGLFAPPKEETSTNAPAAPDPATTTASTESEYDDTIHSMAGINNANNNGNNNNNNNNDNDNDDTINSMAGMEINTSATTGATATTSATTTSLQGLFAPPPAAQTSSSNENGNDNSAPTAASTTSQSSSSPSFWDRNNRFSTVKMGSSIKQQAENAALLASTSTMEEGEQQNTGYYGAYNNSDNDNEAPGRFFQDQKDHHNHHHPFTKTPPSTIISVFGKKVSTFLNNLCKTHLQPTTFAGAFMFLLYHVVFCLAMGSAITRPHNLDKPILGIMAKWSTVGIFFSGPFYIWRLGSDIPALYPSIDLFLAPFLAQAAAIVDDTLYQEYNNINNNNNGSYPDSAFFASFAVLVGIGMGLAGMFLLAASSFKLANLGTFLPYSVLCGFFSAVGVLLWALAFSVDTSGKTWKMVFFSGNRELILDSLLHHIPSLCIGIVMNRLGPKNPFFVILLILMTLILFYTTMSLCGMSLEDAQDAKWFWSEHDLKKTTTGSTTSLVQNNDDNNNNTTTNYNETTFSFDDIFLPPLPFANIFCIFSKHTHWGAVYNGLENMVALAFLYLLRSSIHASAMKKNVNNLVRRIPIMVKNNNNNNTANHDVTASPLPIKYQQGSAISDDTGDTGFENSTRKSMAAQMVGSVRQSVQIVKMSLADDPQGNTTSSIFANNSNSNNNNATSTTATENGDNHTTTTFRSRLVSEYHGGMDSPMANIDKSEQYYSSPPRRPKRSRISLNVQKDSEGNTTLEYQEIRAQPSRKSLEAIFTEYGYALLVVATTGGFGNCPTVATSNTMYAIGAEHPAPQYGSILLLLIFYFTDFELVKYIPKAAFSSLLVLGAVDTLVVWFFGAFYKTLDVSEWLVVPFIVLFSLVVGFLNAVFLGIGISMFVFVASFFRVGVVKFNATGLELRSRIERSIKQSVWLDEHGDFIQALVLQNYLFFGNASSILNYIATMFEDVEDIEEEILLSKQQNQQQKTDYYYDSIPPKPKVLILDLGLITGMDTSTVDIFAEIKELCKNNNCKLFLCSLSSRIKKGLALAGIKPEKGSRKTRIVRFFPDLDTALGKAEDFVMEIEMKPDERDDNNNNNLGNDHLRGLYSLSEGKQSQQVQYAGFLYALQQIDELHGQHFATGLSALAPFVKLVEIQQGNCLFQSDGGVVQDSERGLFFIESGLLKIERDASSQTMTMMTRTKSYQTLNNLNDNSHRSTSSTSQLTLRNQHARMGSVARKRAMEKASAAAGHGYGSSSNTIRIARIGPGWVVGTFENASGYRPAGVVIAMSNCRLHHLPFSKMEELEESNPILILKLYKMLSHIMARKDEITVEHLSTLHTILSSPPQTKPISRSAMKAFAGIPA